MSVVRKFANAPLIFICGAVLLIFASMIGIFSYEKKRLCLFVSLGFIFFTAAGAVFVMYYFYGYWKDYGSQHLSADVNYTRLLRDIIANAKLFGDSGIDMKNTYGITAWNMALRNTNSYLILARYGWAAFIATKLPMTAFSVYSFYRCLCQTSMLGKLISSSAALCLTAQSVVLQFSPLFEIGRAHV